MNRQLLTNVALCATIAHAVKTSSFMQSAIDEFTDFEEITFAETDLSTDALTYTET